MRDLPSGTVTFLFTDIEGSTRLLYELGDRYAEALAEHRRLLRAAFARHGGVEVDMQGDAFFAAFARVSEAVTAAAEAQQALSEGPIRVRMGLHTGEPTVTEDGYVGLDVHRAGRIASAAHGQQVLLSRTTRDLLEPEIELRDLGEHRLKDLAEPQRLYQLGHDEFPPLRSLNQSNLPVQPTALVGRERELGEVLELLRSHRLVTLTGTGGSGKTRLALQAAAELVEEFPDGVWFVSLASLGKPELVEPAIAQTLGVKEPQTIEHYLEHKQALLLLDNFEHLLEAAPRLAVLRQAPKVKLLVTSRASLRLSGEYEFPVPPLSGEEATRFFVERAQAAKPSFRPDIYVPLICRRLDNLPLAIELAAARVKVLSPEALLARLEKRLPLLTGGSRDLPERQQTLRATIEWSYELLDEDERRLFARLAVFAGGCILETAEEVCEGTLDQFASIIDKSLVVLDEDRLSLHETIREYALERLEQSGESRWMRQRHADYFLKRFETVFYGGQESRETFAGIALAVREQDNARAALLLYRDISEREKQARLAGALEPFWAVISPREGQRMLEEVLAYEALPTAVRARALFAAALVKRLEEDPSGVKRLLEEALPLFDQLGDRRSRARVLVRLAEVAKEEGEYRLALELLETSRDLALELSDGHRLATVTTGIADIALRQGDYGQARLLFEDALSQFRSEGHGRGVPLSLLNLGLVAIAEKRLVDAIPLVRESLTAATEFDSYILVGSLDALAAVAAIQGDGEFAARLLGATEEWHSRLGSSQERFEAELRKRTVSAAVETLDAETYSACVAEGRNLGIPAAVDYALHSFE
jgi:predicted ATPase